ALVLPRVEGSSRTHRASVPLVFHSVAARLVTMHRRHESKQAPRRAVTEQMAPSLDLVADLHVLLADAVAEDALRAGRLERPDGRLGAFCVLDLDVDPRA